MAGSVNNLEMYQQVQEFQKAEARKKIPAIKPGDVIKVHQKIMEKGKERIQIFEGLVIALSGNGPLTRRITVRRIASGVGVERTFPLNLPSLTKIEVTKRTKVKRAKLYYVRELTGRRARLEEEKGAILPGAELLIEEAAQSAVLAPSETRGRELKKGEKPEQKSQVKKEVKSEASPQKVAKK